LWHGSSYPIKSDKYEEITIRKKNDAGVSKAESDVM